MEVLPWSQMDCRAGQIGKSAVYGMSGVVLALTGLALGRFRSLSRLGDQPLRGLQVTLVIGSVLLETAAATSIAVGVKALKQPSLSNSSEGQLPPFEVLRLKRELYEAMHSREPNLDAFRALCEQLGAEHLSTAWGEAVEDYPSCTPVEEAVYCIGSLVEREQRMAMLRILLDAGAGVKPVSINNCSAMHIAVFELKGTAREPVIQQLLAHGARFPTFCLYDPSRSSDEGLSEELRQLYEETLREDLRLLDYALVGDCDAARQLLEKGCHPEIRNRSTDCPPELLGKSALMIAVEKGHVEFVRLTLQTGLHPDFYPYSVCGLDIAVASDSPNLEIVQLLLHAGANPVRLQVSEDPLTRVFGVGYKEKPVLLALLEHVSFRHLERLSSYRRSGPNQGVGRASGSEREELTRELFTVLTTGAFSLERVEKLLEAGANANGTDNRGHTPFLYATQWDSAKEIWKLLIKYGGRISIDELEDKPKDELLGVWGLVVGQAAVTAVDYSTTEKIGRLLRGSSASV